MGSLVGLLVVHNVRHVWGHLMEVQAQSHRLWASPNPKVVAGPWAKIDPVCSLEGLLAPLKCSMKWFHSFGLIQDRPEHVLVCWRSVYLFMNLQNNVVNFSALEGGENGTKFSISTEWREQLD